MSSVRLSTKPHYPLLDGLRGVAALIVVTFHLSEPLGTGHLDILVNHGYLAVDFFFLLSGFVIGYAYDERWPRMTLGTFFKRRLERLQPLVVLGMSLGALGFYFTDSPLWPLIHTVPWWKTLLVLLIGYTILPVPLALDVRGWQEMHPFNSVGWSLFFEYVANLLYALGLRKLSNRALGWLVLGAAIALAHLAITSPNGDVSGGWTLNAEQVRVGLTRMLYPFFAGLLLVRVATPTRVRHAFFWCSLLLALVLYMPRIGGATHLWLNGVYEASCIILVFPLLVYLGASGVGYGPAESRLCRWLGELSYPLYLVHYPLVYFYVAWLSRHQGATLGQVWPYALLVLLASIALAYASLKWYDEPVRRWLRRKLG